MQIDLTQARTATQKEQDSLDAAKAGARAALMAFIEATTLAITGPVPLDEKLSWASKEVAARAVLASTASSVETALIADEASVTGENLATLANRIVELADAYRSAIAKLTGLRRSTEAAIDAAATPTAVQTVLQTALTTAAQLLNPET